MNPPRDNAFAEARIPAPSTTFTAFDGERLLVHGELAVVLTALKQRIDRAVPGAPQGEPLIFRDADGRAFDFDLRGTLDDVLARYSDARDEEKKGRGRPKLGVVSREISLLPRHWDWLEEQPSGISAALRRLVEEAIKREPEKQRARRAAEATSRILSAIAGDRPGFEDVLRALFAGDQTTYLAGIKRWPPDIRSYAKRLAEDAFSP